MPTDLPKGLRLTHSCWSDGINVADFFYGSEDRKGQMLMVVRRTVESSPSNDDDESTITLGDLVGSVSDEVAEDGTGYYAIQFDKDSLLYRVYAILGSDNTVTDDDIRSVAPSIAEK